MEVSTEREGGSQLCAVKGTEVSIVIGLESEEIERRREKAAVKGLRNLDPTVEEDEEDDDAKRDSAMSI